MVKYIKKYFISGILVTLPLLITVYVLIQFLQFADGILGRFINRFLEQFLGFYIPGLGLILFLVIIFFAGFLTSNFLGRKLYNILDRILRRFPLVRDIYFALKQIAEFLFTSKHQSFKKAVLIEYPRRGVWSLGFVTNEAAQEIKGKVKLDLVSIFIPSSPGPFTGFFIFLPLEEVVFLDIAIEDAIKLIISGGLVRPPVLPSKKP